MYIHTLCSTSLSLPLGGARAARTPVNVLRHQWAARESAAPRPRRPARNQGQQMLNGQVRGGRVAAALRWPAGRLTRPSYLRVPSSRLQRRRVTHASEGSGAARRGLTLRRRTHRLFLCFCSFFFGIFLLFSYYSSFPSSFLLFSDFSLFLVSILVFFF